MQALRSSAEHQSTVDPLLAAAPRHPNHNRLNPNHTGSNHAGSNHVGSSSLHSDLAERLHRIEQLLLRPELPLLRSLVIITKVIIKIIIKVIIKVVGLSSSESFV